MSKNNEAMPPKIQRATLPLDDFNRGAMYLLHTDFSDMDNIEYTLWRREREVFVHVDTFFTFNNASKEAQQIIKSVPKFIYLANN